jgi:serine/threonine-protein kinase
MAPEAFVETNAVEARSDLYSLGAMAYLLLTGTPVFTGNTAVEICANHIHAQPERPSTRLGRELPPDLEQLVLACLAKRPAQRPAGAAALRAALDGCSDAGRWSEEQAESWWTTHAEAIEARRRTLGRAGSSMNKSVLVERAHHTTPLSDTAPAPAAKRARIELW